MSADPVEAAKRSAARQAVDEYVKDGMVVGVGSGSTIVHAVERMGELRDAGLSFLCVPTSFQAQELCAKHGLTVVTLNSHPEIDVAIDGADEVDPGLNCIKGGGGCQLQEKLVAAYARVFVVIADHRKRSGVLGSEWRKGVPIEVLPLAYVPVSNKLKEMGGTPVLRRAEPAKAGPVVTDNGNFILDVDFGIIADPGALNTRLLAVVGIVETGLFVGMAAKAFFGLADGSVEVWTPR